MPANVLLLGATGLIGSHLLAMLQSDPRIERIYAPTRHPLSNAGNKVINPTGSDVQILLDTLTEPVDAAFCCLGTTQKPPVAARLSALLILHFPGNDSNLLIVFYVQIMPDDFVMQLHRF
ncbi:hypothetical protein GWG09_24155 (plasmid) [Escherichia coli]|uniref:hypothetical protein n=1 Tax=Escherichia coli TaxID=562 RepID=UPI00137BEDE4|nr:hypothetical protein [Escherichia coli]QHS08614.1 hypothetical protein GWG09_24155 [Escherichia coli]